MIAIAIAVTVPSAFWLSTVTVELRPKRRRSATRNICYWSPRSL
ncbi:hypothetical protein [Dactylosporangium sp. NPDC006015]